MPENESFGTVLAFGIEVATLYLYNSTVKKSIILLLFAFSFLQMTAQSIGAFEDVRNYFFVFDDGRIEQLETQKVRDYKVARNFLVWINIQGQFKMYENGYTKVLLENPPNFFGITDNILIYEMNDQVFVYEYRRSRRVAAFVKDYAFGDSVISFLDWNNGLNVYYRGRTRNLEVFDVTQRRVGKNVVAYVDNVGEFHCFHGGETYDLDYLVPVSFKVGRNTVAFVDNYNRFKIYHKGNIVQADPFPPRVYETGDDLVAWVNRNGQFMVFEDGLITQVEDLNPNKFVVNDAIVAYELPNRHFKAYYKGQIFDLESYIPESYKIDNEVLVWVDYMNNLKALYYGEQVKPANRIVRDYNVFLDVVVSDVNMARPQFFYKGKIY